MADLEKVIKGLACRLECGCMNEDHCNPECPYLGDPRACYGLDEDALALMKEQKPRVMTLEEVKKKVGSGEYVFTECEKEGQWMRYGDARLSVDQGDSCRIAFLISRRGDDPYVRWWMIYYKNYNKTWRCWTSRPTDEQREAVK